MKKQNLIIIIIGIIILIGLFSYFKVTGNAVKGPGKYDEFAQCLTDKGAKMYGTEWCSHCKSQKKMFGNSFQYIDYIDCDKNKDACLEAGVRGYPTWKINGENYPGEQLFGRLSRLTGCEIQ
jgi:glutaredoxin